MTEAQIAAKGKPARTAPVLGKERLDFVDVLRGFALIGVLVANIPSFMGQTGGIRAYPGVLDLSVRVLIQFLVQTKFYHMFSFLFGWGMSMQWRRAEARGAKFVPVFIRRLLILLAFGTLHGIFIWTGDILAMYAIYGFLLLAFRKRSERFILISMLVFLAYPLLRSLPIPPAEAFNEWYQHITAFLHFGDTAQDVLKTGTYWEVTRLRFEEFVGRQSLLGYAIGNIFAMFLFGLYVGKRRIFENVSQYFGLLRKVMWIGLAVGVVFNAGFTMAQLDPTFFGSEFRLFAYTASYTIGAPFMMLFYVSGLTLLLHPESGYGKFANFVRTRKPFFQRLLWVWVPLAGALTYAYTRFKASTGASRPGLVHGALALVIVFDVLVILLFFTLVFADKFAWRNRLFSLRFVGRMALTNYLSQSVVCTLIFYGYGLGLYGELGPAVGLAFSAALYMTQLFLSEWWLLRYQFGPVEYVWRTLTYGRRQPLRIGVTYADLQAPRWMQRLRGWTAALPVVLKLGLVWVLLLGWGVGLFYWNTHLSQREEAASFELLEEQPEAAESEPVSGDGDTVEVVAIATPQVIPVAYNPGPVVASGDLGQLAATFDAERALATVGTLTNAPYLGRAAGSLEGFRAGSYIASRFEAYGLQPAGDEGTFFQSFPVSYASLEAEPTISVTAPGGELFNSYQPHQDFAPYVKGYAGSGTASGAVVWVNDCLSEDFNTANAAGKIALCNDIDPLAAGRHAMEYGAQGLLLLTNPDERPADTGMAYADTWVPVSIPVLRVYPALVSDLLTGSGKNVPDLSITYLPFDLQTRVTFSVQASTSDEECPVEGCEARNVLGVLPGRDPALADEVIIVAANYDQYGQSPDGAVWAGANDNASGVAVLLEL
ncbi:MAG: DUF418 domain-containing protein, partial [Anaerolineales bacterium]|nr:DUF418 domain-containing protein [Anaerolineales bacterium]